MMDDTPPAAGEPGERPPGRLDRAPGERYQPPRMGRLGRGATIDPTGSPARAVVSGAIAAAAALIVFLVFAGPLSFSTGLVVIAVFAGRLVGLVVRTAAGPTVSSDARIVMALLLTIAWFAAAQVGVWLYARAEGGALPLLDFLGQVFGPLVPLQLMVAVLVAWWSAR